VVEILVNYSAAVTGVASKKVMTSARSRVRFIDGRLCHILRP
jgi:hypothetical protein